MTKYWTNIEYGYHHYPYIQFIPFADMYIEMEHIEKKWYLPMFHQRRTRLCPTTEVDRQELAVWLRNLLTRMCQEVSCPKFSNLFCHQYSILPPKNIPSYRPLLKDWINWIIEHNIPLGSPSNNTVNSTSHNILNLPYSDWYFAMACTQHSQPPDSGPTAVLSPKTRYDRLELGVWLEAILHQIYNEVCLNICREGSN